VHSVCTNHVCTGRMTNGRIDGRKNERWVDGGCVFGWMDGWMDGEWMSEWMWKDESVSGLVLPYLLRLLLAHSVGEAQSQHLWSGYFQEQALLDPSAILQEPFPSQSG
jgi:hypothetical protein